MNLTIHIKGFLPYLHLVDRVQRKLFLCPSAGTIYVALQRKKKEIQDLYRMYAPLSIISTQ